MDKDEEIALLRGLLGETLRRSVGTYSSIVTLAADLARRRPPLLLEKRTDGAWIARFDVKKSDDT